MFITTGMVRLIVYMFANFFFLPLAFLESIWWFVPLFAIAAIDYFIFLRRKG